MNFQILDPWYLTLIIVAPILHFIAKRLKPSYDELYVSDVSLFQNPHSSLLRWRKLPFIFYYSALFCCIIALSRPAYTWDEIKIEGEGIDISMVIDLSGSMLADDFSPNRLEVAKEVAAEFVNNRKTDRLALICFAGEAYTLIPLTTDRSMVIQAIRRLEIGELKDGTAIGMGIATAINRMKKSDAKSKVIILMTDGDNNAGVILPMDAAAMASQLGIKIYTIGIGSDTYANLPVGVLPNGEYVYRKVKVTLDESVLKALAEQTSGMYFRATDKTSLVEIYNTIDQLEKVKIEQQITKKHKDIYHRLLAMGVLLCTIGLSMHFTIFKTSFS